MEQLTTIKGINFTAIVSNNGAELKSIKHLNGTEFMWQADADIWPRTAPVLFPIVGKVKNDLLRVKDKGYAISQHGFARDKKFSLIEQTENKLVYQLLYSDETLQKFPYDFKLILTYEWIGDKLICGYEVYNLGVETMPFSIGAHPGFLIPDGDFSQCELLFNKPETSERHLLENGLFNHQTQLVLNNTQVLPLSVELFDLDAVVFKNLQSNQVSLVHKNSSYRVTMSFDGFPHFGIWAKKGSQRFVCLEPWFGHSDYTEGHPDITKKEGVLALPSHESFKTNYILEFEV
ncbi:MAG: aldose 1-epimerase family protein [Bacteroidia bacterium]